MKIIKIQRAILQVKTAKDQLKARKKATLKLYNNIYNVQL